MTPQERERVAELFDRLATLESARRDPEAEAAILDGLKRAPHAIYSLVQSVLVQDEALKEAQARLREYEGEAPQQPQDSFLDSMRDTLFGGGRANARGSVPPVRGSAGPGEFAQNRGLSGLPGQPANAPAGQGGSFLGTAAAAAVGVIGGTMLMNSLGSLMGGHKQHGMLDSANADKAPWGDKAGEGDLARQAGVEDIGRGDRFAADESARDRAGFFDTAQTDDDFGDDLDFGDSDIA